MVLPELHYLQGIEKDSSESIIVVYPPLETIVKFLLFKSVVVVYIETKVMTLLDHVKKRLNF